MIRQPMAEFAGVAVFVILGTGVDCQIALSANKDISTSKGVRYYQAHEANYDLDGAILCRTSSLLALDGQSVSPVLLEFRETNHSKRSTYGQVLPWVPGSQAAYPVDISIQP